MNIPTVKTKHLSLVPLQAGDAAILHRVYQSEGIFRYFPVTIPPPLEKVERFIVNQREHWEKYGYGNWGVLPDGEKEIVGWVGLQYLPELNEVEVGYLLDSPFWGKGFATEAARASLEFAERFDFARVIALVHPDNLASRRVVEKCGMVYTETIHLWGIELMRFHSPASSRNSP